MYKVFMLLSSLLYIAVGDSIKRDLIGQQPHGLELLHLGHLGPLARLSSHPSFAHLGLTPPQVLGFTQVLLENGYLNPNILKLANGQPFIPVPPSPAFFTGNPFSGFLPMADPYFIYLLSNYARFLPYGLGPQGIYGTTGLPKFKPSFVPKFNDKIQ